VLGGGGGGKSEERCRNKLTWGCGAGGSEFNGREKGNNSVGTIS